MRRLALFALLAACVVVAVLLKIQSTPESFAALAPAATPSPAVPEQSIVDQDAPYVEACARAGLSSSECLGRLIWFKATAGNDRFHTYTFQQRIGVLID